MISCPSSLKRMTRDGLLHGGHDVVLRVVAVGEERELPQADAVGALQHVERLS
jgi:hypothetical protein